MTRSEYAREVTRILDEKIGRTAEYPESFESDIDALLDTLLWQRMSAEDAAEKLYKDWFA